MTCTRSRNTLSIQTAGRPLRAICMPANYPSRCLVDRQQHIRMASPLPTSTPSVMR
jgi:hypothetical protein